MYSWWQEPMVWTPHLVTFPGTRVDMVQGSQPINLNICSTVAYVLQLMPHSLRVLQSPKIASVTEKLSVQVHEFVRTFCQINHNNVLCIKG